MRALATLLLLFAVAAQGQLKPVNPAVQKIVDAVSQDHITETLKTLESFQNRNIYSDQDTPGHGIGAARKWIFAQFESYSPRLQVRYDIHHLKRNNTRLPRDLDLYNVVAVLPGKVNPERQFLITAHYDSAIYPKRKEGETEADIPLKMDPALSEPSAPGVTDDGSGVAAVLELARVMSQYEFEKTIVFVAFAGEEEGLLGSNAYARDARREGQIIDGVLNNDIIGSDVSGNGRTNNGTVWVFSEDPADSPSRELARYIHESAMRYVPSMQVDLVFRRDRFQRGGDHTSFNLAGFPGVRFTTPTENFANQHTVTDTFANTSPAYTTRVAKVNAGALASLALSPKAPVVNREIEKGPNKGRKALLIDRGKSGYAAHLRWRAESTEPDLAGYSVVSRLTTSPDWEREIFVGKVNEYSFEDVSIDNLVFGVRAIDQDGNESLVSPYEPATAHPEVAKRKNGIKTAEEVVDGELEAYNARDIDAVLAFYSPDAVLLNQQTGKPVATGAEALRAVFATVFKDAPDLHGVSLSRTTSGDWVVDHQKVTGAAGGKDLDRTLLFEVKDGLIRRVWVLD